QGPAARRAGTPLRAGALRYGVRRPPSRSCVPVLAAVCCCFLLLADACCCLLLPAAGAAPRLGMTILEKEPARPGTNFAYAQPVVLRTLLTERRERHACCCAVQAVAFGAPAGRRGGMALDRPGQRVLPDHLRNRRARLAPDGRPVPGPVRRAAAGRNGPAAGAGGRARPRGAAGR